MKRFLAGHSSLIKRIILILLTLLLMTTFLFHLYLYLRPKMIVSKEIQLYRSGDKEVLWDTAESTRRGFTNFSDAELENTFTSNNNILHAYKDWQGEDAPYSAAYTRHRYANYILELEYRWMEGKFNPRLNKPRDAGIIFHVYGYSNTPWPSGLEYQLLEPDQSGMLVTVRTRVKIRQADKKYDPTQRETVVGKHKGYRHIRVSPSVVKPQDWNKVRIEVKGDSAVYYLNEEKILSFTEAEYYHPVLRRWFPLTKGRIVLQAEGAEVQYRHVRLRPLD